MGATGAKAAKPDLPNIFMMRIGIPNGIISFRSSCHRWIDAQYARNLADITVRQNIQIHVAHHRVAA